MNKEELKEKKKQELIRFLDNLMKSDVSIAQKKLIDERQKTIKTGDNVIHLTYLESLLNESDIKEIENEVKKSNLQLSYYNKSGIIYASANDYSLTIYFALSQPIIKFLLEGIGTNAIWDFIKYIIVKTWGKIKKNKKASDKKMKYGIKITFDKNNRYDIELNGNEKQVLEILDKIVPFLKKQSLKKDGIRTEADYIYYDKKKKIFRRVDVMKEHRKKALKQGIERQKEALKNEPKKHLKINKK